MLRICVIYNSIVKIPRKYLFASIIEIYIIFYLIRINKIKLAISMRIC